MNRRHFLRTAAGLGALTLVPLARGATQCGLTPFGQACRSQVDFAEFYQDAYDIQYRSQWCWAACIAMVLAFHGHPVSQQRIVQEAYGLPVNMPAPGLVIARQLQRRWVDDSGERFRVRIDGVYDASAGVLATDNRHIVAALDEERPLIIGAGGHAMVLTALDYRLGPMGVSPLAAGVFDPWPGRGPRGLAPPELVPAHLGGALTFVIGIRVA